MSRIISTAELKKLLKQLACHHGGLAKTFLKFAKEDRGDKPLARSWARDARRSFAWQDACQVVIAHLETQPKCIVLPTQSAVCRECNQPLDQVADCTCIVRPAPKPLRQSAIRTRKSAAGKGGVH